jgi:hypothetical protein
MQSSARRIVLSAGLSAASLTGCYSPYGYQSPYAPNYYGQPYQNPSGPVLNGPVLNGPVLGPDGTYAPGTSGSGTGSPTPTTAPGGTTNTPAGSPPNTYDNSGNGINWQTPNNGNNNAPPFDSSPGGTSPSTPAGGNRGTVPDPVDDLNNSGPSANKPALVPTSNSARDDLQSPFGESGNVGAPSQPARVTSEPDLFEPPLQLNGSATSNAAAIQTVGLDPTQDGKLNPYGRDTKNANPTWLRGVIDYDEQDRSWSIVYAAAPNPRDPNGGNLTLSNHPSLLNCRSGEVVLVEGSIDANTTDSRGKPVYAVKKMTQLTAE